MRTCLDCDPFFRLSRSAKQQQQQLLPAGYDGDLEPLGDEDDGASSAVAAAGGAAGGDGGRSSSSGYSGGAAGWLLSGCGGWAADDHSAFVKHRERLMREREVAQAGSK